MKQIIGNDSSRDRIEIDASIEVVPDEIHGRPRKQVKKQASPGAAARREDPVQSHYVGEMLSVIVQFLRSEGVDKRTLRKLLLYAARKLSPDRSAAARAVEAGARISDLMRCWCTDPRFLDATGQPASLPVKGKGSFTELVRWVLPQATVTMILAQALRRELVMMMPGQRVSCLTRTASFRTRPSDRLARTTYLIEQLLGTTTLNAGEPRRARRRLDRSVHETVLASDAALFQALARVQGKSLIDFLDDWLAKAAARARGSRARKVTVGLECFAYQRGLPR